MLYEGYGCITEAKAVNFWFPAIATAISEIISPATGATIVAPKMEPSAGLYTILTKPSAYPSQMARSMSRSCRTAVLTLAAPNDATAAASLIP
eukprot:CAMPEP_0184393866 /NCGR_PEP_ID=MMETSP0007-20130409/37137_1 /TAXON_ID=97485 /ORGANISM="Prymnesium parvum, Strain Texoma1" /LENGTH=92 /DNA_ID=CAMNT_0026745131 /DNA_START=420 /DNA_END=695 /DNA_ORIENTATION=-